MHVSPLRRSAPSSTRSRLIALTAAILIPIAVFAALLLWQFARAERARFEITASDLAAQLGAVVDRELIGLTAALEAFAASVTLPPAESLATLDAKARALVRSRGSFVAIRDRTGQQIINTAVPFGAPLPVSTDPDLLAADRAVFETGKPTISNLYTGSLTGRKLITIDAPMFRDGVIVYVVNLALAPARLSELLTADTKPDWTASLIDRNDRIIARSRNAERFLGSEATPDLRRAAVGERGAWQGTTLDGLAVISAYERSPVSGWRMAVGIASSTIQASLTRFTVLLASSTAFVFLFSMLVAARIARAISTPLGQLTQAARLMGQRASVPALTTGLREVDEVARALGEADRDIRQRETELQASEERFRAAVRAVDGVVWTNDASGRMRGEQPGWAALTGQSFAQYQDYGWADAVHPDDAAPTLAAWNEAFRERRTFVFEHRVRRADGVYRRFSIRSVPVVDEHGTIREWVGVHTDITEEYEAKASLAESQARLRAVFEAVPVGVVIAEAPSGRLIDSNRQTELILGHSILPTETIEDHGKWVGFHADGRRVEAGEYPLARVVAGEEDRPELELRYRRGDGSLIWVRIVGAPIRDGAGTLVGGVVAILDIDRKKRAEAELRDLNATLERRVQQTAADRDRIWRISTELMLVARFDGEIVAVNPAWTVTLGWSERELVGRRVPEFLHPDDVERTVREERALSQGQTTLSFENRYKHRDGSIRWLSWTAVPEAGLVHAIARDVTAEKLAAEALRRTEEQLRQSQKMEVVGQLTGGVAHDFNNLLTVITGHLEIARKRIEGEAGGARTLRNLDAALDGANRAATLTHRLLAFARQSPLRPEVLELNKTVSGMSELIRRTLGENIAIETVLAGGLWRTEADPNQVESAILNLCINARDAMPGGGKLTVETANAFLDESYPAVAKGEISPGQYAMIAVCDTGTGMTPEVLDRVFEPFFTTKPVGKGTGLGLSQVFGFLRQSAGHAAIYSEPGHGTTVKLYFPRHNRPGHNRPGQNPVEPVPAELPAPQPGRGETILVVEDDPMVRAFTTSALEDAGYRVLSAPTGPDGLALLDAHPEIALLFTDVVLAGALNGRQVALEALNRRPDLKIVYTTGYTRNAIMHHGRLDEGLEVIVKPFTASALAMKIRKVLG